jgi:hypothetical protein
VYRPSVSIVTVSYNSVIESSGDLRPRPMEVAGTLGSVGLLRQRGSGS